MMGCGAFIYAVNYSNFGLAGSGVLAPGVFIIFLALKLIRELRFCCKHRSCFKSENSSWRKDDGTVRWDSLIPLFCNVGVNIGYIIVMTFAWKFADQAGLNPGVISSLLCFASVFNVIVFYCAFKERVSKLHLIGVALMFCGIACIGAAAATREEEPKVGVEVDDGGRSSTINGLLALVVGMGGPCLISFQHYIIRKFSRNYSGLEQAFDAAVLTNALFCLFLIKLSEEMTITWRDLGIGLAAEILMETSHILLSYGVSIGLAGPAQALMSTHAMWQSLCGAIFANKTLNALQIAGILLGLVGVFSITYFDYLANKLA